MRAAVLLLISASAGWAQFKSTVPLVVAPTTVRDAKGRFVDGLTREDLALYDNNVAQAIQMDWMLYPISLVVAIETGPNAGAVIDKLGGSGILLTQLLAAHAGKTAVISFSDRVRVHQEFTADSDQVTHALQMLRTEGDGASILDALSAAAAMLEKQPPARRRIILMVAEKRDRGSESKLPDVVERIERVNIQVFWLTYSPFLQPFSVRPKTAEDTKPEAERIKVPKCAWCPAPDDTPVPPDLGPGGYLYALKELFRLHRPDLAALFASTTGGRTEAFLKKRALEHAIEQVGEEVHRQYVLSFQPRITDAGKFHTIRVAVKNRPELEVTTRAGYWAVQ